MIWGLGDLAGELAVDPYGFLIFGPVSIYPLLRHESKVRGSEVGNANEVD